MREKIIIDGNRFQTLIIREEADQRVFPAINLPRKKTGGRYFENRQQAATFREIARTALDNGAIKVGLTGSRAEGTQYDWGKDGDVDVVAVFPPNHWRTGDKALVWDTIPGGGHVPEGFEFITIPEDHPDKISSSMDAKAKWWFKRW